MIDGAANTGTSVRDGFHAVAWLLQSQGHVVEWHEDDDGWWCIVHPLPPDPPEEP